LEKITVIWLIIGVALGGFLFQTEISEALYSIPPTWSFSNMTIDGTSLEADRHNDEVTINAGIGITLTPNAALDSFTISSTGGSATAGD
jgi:hypothetical protein